MTLRIQLEAVNCIKVSKLTVLRFRCSIVCVADRQIGATDRPERVKSHLRTVGVQPAKFVTLLSHHAARTDATRRTVNEDLNKRLAAAEFETLLQRGDRKQTRIFVCTDRRRWGQKEQKLLFIFNVAPCMLPHLLHNPTHALFTL
jgi:hypothetical protein